MDAIIPVIIVIIIVIIAYFHQKSLRRQSLGKTQIPTLAIFHPWCDDGGGGERVLWFIVMGLSTLLSKKIKIYIYTDSKINKDELIIKVYKQFNLQVNKDDITLIPLKFCSYLKPNNYPIFTLLFQNLASILVAINAAYNFEPDIYMDTTGFAFTFLIFKLFSFSKTVTYMHYPTITNDMIKVVQNRKKSFNNNETITRITFLTRFKLIYYKIMLYLYYLSGKCIDITIVNSKWTYNHIKQQWLNKTSLHLIYPPCGIEKTAKDIKIMNDKRNLRILSLGQYRPEKDQKMQLFIFKRILDELVGNIMYDELEFYMIGGCRNDKDFELLNKLKKLAIDLGINKKVKFIYNVDCDELNTLLETSLIGIHTMKDEHFGIGIVEMAANGLIVIAHKSGGPLLDIIKSNNLDNGYNLNKDCTGFLAQDINEYVFYLKKILSMSDDNLQNIRQNALNDMYLKFSDTVFIEKIINVFLTIIA